MEVIRRSGEEALSYYGKGNSRIKFDEELVTEADSHLMEFFQDQLDNHFPEHQVFKNNQANTDYTHDEKRYIWIFDPLDGVANFQAGIPIWGISLALIENFWPIFGVFYMPATGDLFHARADQKAFLGDEEIRVSDLEEYQRREPSFHVFTISSPLPFNISGKNPRSGLHRRSHMLCCHGSCRSCRDCE